MQPFVIQQQDRQTITCSQLPLAVYREVAAHLEQVQGIKTKLISRPIEPQPGAKFDYYQSQIAGLEISYPDQIAEKDKQQVAAILDYYGQRYRPWETISGE